MLCSVLSGLRFPTETKIHEVLTKQNVSFWNCRNYGCKGNPYFLFLHRYFSKPKRQCAFAYRCRLRRQSVLTLNCFSFAGNYYKQINGVAMGTRMGPSYANLFVGYVEHQFFNQYNGPKPELYGRYIDDCIGAISSSREELDQFITSVNSFHPALKYTWEISETSLAFLDIKVSIRGNVLCTSVHYKPTDSHS